jgi:phage-related tail fiber protein
MTTKKGQQYLQFARVGVATDGDPILSRESTALLADRFGRLIVTLNGSSGGGVPGSDSFPLIDDQYGLPEPGKWAIVEGGTVTLPGGVPDETRIGFFTVDVTNLTTEPGFSFLYNGVGYTGFDTVVIPPFVYLEWSMVDSVWVPRGMSNESVSGGSGGGSGWLEYATGPAMLDGKWVITNNNTLSLLPDAVVGRHVGLWVDNSTGGGGATVSCATGSFMIDRNTYDANVEVPVRGGSWYEWVCRDYGEGIRWIPVNGSANSAKPPLEYVQHPFVRPAYPNMWDLASNDTAQILPESAQNGDVYGIYADVGCTVRASTGDYVEAPDLSTIAESPDGISLIAGTYYEWIYTSADSTWHPRQNMIMTGGGGGGGGDSLPILEDDVGTPTVGTWALFPGGTFTFPELVPFESQIGLFTLAATTLTAPVGRQFLYNGTLYEGPASVAIPAHVYCEWSYLQSTFGDTTMWVPRGASNESVAPAPVDTFPIIEDIYGTPTVNTWALVEGGTVTLPATGSDGDRIGFFTYDEPCNLTSTGGTVDWIYNGVWYSGTEIVVIPANVYVEWTFIDGAWIPRGMSNEAVTPAPVTPDSTYKDPVRVVATTNSASLGLLTIDEVTLVAGDRVLLTGQTLPRLNGIWIAATTAWARASDANTSAKVVAETLVPVSEGTLYSDTLWLLTTNNPIVLDTTSLTFAQLPNTADKVRIDASPTKEPCRAVSITNITLSGLQTIDGVSLAANERVLVTGQTTQSTNGLYTAQSGAWVRTTDADTTAKISSGFLVAVSEGTLNADTLWMLSSNAPLTLGPSALVFIQAGGPRGTATPQPVSHTSAADPGGTGTAKWAIENHTHNLVSPYKLPVRAVATANITLSGTQTIDGVAVIANDRVLVAGQTTAANNGIYTVLAGSWVRTTDAFTGNVQAGSIVPVNEGTVNADTLWMLTTDGAITLTVTNLTFTQLAGLRPAGIAPNAITPLGTGGPGASSKWAPIDHSHPFQWNQPWVNGFRISTSLTTPIPLDGSYSTIFLAPHVGNKISLWDNTLFVWQIVTNPTVNSANLTGHTAGVPVDVFARWIGSTTSLAVDLVNWATATTRSVVLTTQDGVTVRSGTPQSRYVGTILPDSATTYNHVSSAVDANKAICAIWNQDNKISSGFKWEMTPVSWTHPTGNASAVLGGGAAPHIELVLGQVTSLRANAIASVGFTAGAVANLGIAFDSTTTMTGQRGTVQTPTGQITPISAHAEQRGGTIGRRTVNLLAYQDALGTDFYSGRASGRSGITVLVEH